MAYVFSKGTIAPFSGALFMYNWLVFMEANGFEVVMSGDGDSLYSPTGNVFVDPGSGPGGMNNFRSWFVLKYPNSNRQLLFRAQNNPGIAWSYLYSYAGLFSGGNFNTVPTAADEQRWAGYSLSGGSIFSGTETTDYVMMVQDEAPYTFLVFGKAQAQTNLINFIIQGDCVQAATACPGDPDPYVFFGPDFTNFVSAYYFPGGDGIKVDNDFEIALRGRNYAWSGYGTVNQFWRAFSWSPFTLPPLFIPGRVAVNPFTNKDQLVALSYGGMLGPQNVSITPPYTSNPQWKGLSTLYRYVLTNRLVGDTFNLDGGTKNWLCVGQMAVPWDGTDSPFSTP